MKTILDIDEDIPGRWLVQQESAPIVRMLSAKCQRYPHHVINPETLFVHARWSTHHGLSYQCGYAALWVQHIIRESTVWALVQQGLLARRRCRRWLRWNTISRTRPSISALGQSSWTKSLQCFLHVDLVAMLACLLPKETIYAR